MVISGSAKTGSLLKSPTLKLVPQTEKNKPSEVKFIPPEDSSEIFTAQEFASYIKCTVLSVKNMRLNGFVQGYSQVSEHTIVYFKSTLERYLHDRYMGDPSLWRFPRREEIFDQKEAQKYLKVGVQLLRDLRNSGKIRGYIRLADAKHLYLKWILDEFLKERFRDTNLK